MLATQPGASVLGIGLLCTMKEYVNFRILAGVGLPIDAGIFAAHKVLTSNLEKNFNRTQQDGLGGGLPALKEVWDWQVFMNNLGPATQGMQRIAPTWTSWKRS